MATKRTDEEYIDAARQSKYMKQMLEILNLKTMNYKSLRERLKRLNIDTSHWETQNNFRFKKGNQLNVKPILEQLVEYAPNLKSSTVRNKLVKEGHWVYQCYNCKISDWDNKSLTLQLDHINGINTDYRLENLRLLCPNCHSQTDTYCGKNVKRKEKLVKIKFCECGVKIYKSSKNCVSCSNRKKKKQI